MQVSNDKHADLSKKKIEYSGEPSKLSPNDELFEGKTVLLDTSAFKDLPKGKWVQAARGGFQLTASPYCFWELLCHLDEEPDFKKAKGRLIKFHGVKIVDKPFDRALVKNKPDAEKKVWSSDLIYAALAAVEAASSLDDLNASLIVDEAGNERALKDCVNRIKEVLDEEENRFREVMTKLISVIKSGQVKVDKPIDQHNAILSLVASRGTPLPDTADLDYETVDEDQLIAFTYVYWGYVIHRAIQLANAGGRTCAKNDFEDGQLCAYIPLDRSMIVVSGDIKLLETLAAVRDVLMKNKLGKRARFALAAPGFLL